MSNDASTQESMRSYDSLSSPLNEFLELQTEQVINGRIASDDFCAEFTLYLARKNISGWSKIRISREMRSRGYELRTVAINEGGRQTTKQFWLGLKWL